jgi:hypothetical protein
MAIGPGKYDDLCTQVRESAQAKGAIVIVLDGERGSGFSVQADLASTLRLPDLLDIISRQIRDDMMKNDNEKN